MIVSELELYEALAEHLGKEKAKILVNFVETKIDKSFDQRKDIIATKQDLADLKVTLKQDISEVEVRLTRTIFLASIGQYLAILASIIAVIKLMH